MSGTNLQQRDTIAATVGASGTTSPFQVWPYDVATLTIAITNPGVDGTPQVILQASNSALAMLTPGSAEWTDLVTIPALVNGAGISDTRFDRHFFAYRLVHSGGAAGDVISYNLYRMRAR